MRNYSMPGNVERACGCKMEEPGRMTGFVPAMAYVPWQNMGTLYELDEALEVGTLFPELNKPFLAAGRGRACR